MFTVMLYTNIDMHAQQPPMVQAIEVLEVSEGGKYLPLFAFRVSLRVMRLFGGQNISGQ